MPTDLKEIEHSALNLDPENKARLANKLLQSIYGEIEQDIEQAWIQEVQKRRESLKSGEASLHSSTEVISEARKRLKGED